MKKNPKNQSKTSLPEVSGEFISENKRYSNEIVNSGPKKGGPYTKNERDSRRNEVYRLHFEYGYSARKISELMKINRNTINGDIEFWYDKVVKNWRDLSPEILVIRSMERLELQRTRLIENLNKTESAQEKTSIERMVLDVESKIVQTQLKLWNSYEGTHKQSTKWLNKWMKKNGHIDRYISYGDVIRVPEKSAEKIRSLLKTAR